MVRNKVGFEVGVYPCSMGFWTLRVLDEWERPGFTQCFEREAEISLAPLRMAR